MKIKKIDIHNFKRFSKLTIDHIPIESKLVLLIGENGSGKSSIFDAFEWLSRLAKKVSYKEDEAYYKKNKEQAIKVHIELDQSREISKEDTIYTVGSAFANRFYGRSSLRIVPRITNVRYSPQIIDIDSDLFSLLTRWMLI